MNQPTYEELLAENKLLKKKIRVLELQLEKLSAKLRQYLNENTPSGAIPIHLKETLEKAVGQPKEKPQTSEKTTNIRNARPEKVGRTEHLELCECPNCHGKLTKKKRVRSRTILRIQMPVAEAVKYKIPEYYCPNCKKEVRPKVPDALPNSKFDLNTTILVSFFSVALNTPVSGIRTMFSNVFGLEICEGSISNALQGLKDYLGDKYLELEAELMRAKVRYKDETGWRTNGKLNWAWVCASANAIIYKIEKSRKHEIAKKMENPNGVDVCDGYGAYSKLDGQRQRCWAHMLRIAKNPEHSFSDEKEVEEYIRLAEGLGLLFHQAKEDKKRREVSPELKKEYEKKLLCLLMSVKRLGRNADKLMNYIMKFEDEWFTFLMHKDVEPTNNFAERSLRHLVIKRKVSQQSRSEKSKESYAMQASIYMSARQRDENYVDLMRNVLEGQISELGKS